MYATKILSRWTNLAMRNINLSSFGSVYARFVDYVFYIAAVVAVVACVRVRLSHKMQITEIVRIHCENYSIDIYVLFFLSLNSTTEHKCRNERNLV